MAEPTPLCSDQPNLTPVTTQVFGCNVPARRKAVQAVQGQAITITWQFVDDRGLAVDLTTCGDFDPDDVTTGAVRLRTRETTFTPSEVNELDVLGEVTDLTTGSATFAVGADATATPGVYMAEAVVLNGAGHLIFANQFYLIVNRGLSGSEPTGSIPSVAEIRLHLRDSDPGDNPLLETVQFDLAELAICIEKPVLYWNESLPPIRRTYKTTSFPYRYYWLEGVISQLYLIAAHWYRRNQLALGGQGGTSVDDLNKSKEYEAIGQQKWAEYKGWVKEQKVRLNAEGAIQSQASPYQWGWR